MSLLLNVYYSCNLGRVKKENFLASCIPAIDMALGVLLVTQENDLDKKFWKCTVF